MRKTTTAKFSIGGHIVELPTTIGQELGLKMADVETARQQLQDNQIKMNARPKKLPHDTDNPNDLIAIDPNKSKSAALVQLRRTQERLGQGLQPEPTGDDQVDEALEQTRQKIAKQRDLVSKTPAEARKILAATQALLGKESRLKTNAANAPQKKKAQK